MIDRRPERLQTYRERLVVPPVPFTLSWEWAPELVRASLLPLCGIQPVTRAMSDAAGGTLHTAPTEGEIEYFRRKQTRFQMIQVVMNLAWWEERGGVVSAVPFAISILPASKRGELTTVDVERIAALDAACAYLQSRLGKPVAVERFRQAMDLPDPDQREQAAAALQLAKAQFWGTRSS